MERTYMILTTNALRNYDYNGILIYHNSYIDRQRRFENTNGLKFNERYPRFKLQKIIEFDDANGKKKFNAYDYFKNVSSFEIILVLSGYDDGKPQIDVCYFDKSQSGWGEKNNGIQKWNNNSWVTEPFDELAEDSLDDGEIKAIKQVLNNFFNAYMKADNPNFDLLQNRYLTI